MEIKIKVKNKDGEWWEEFVEEGIEDPKKWAEDMIAKYNATMYPGDLPRELLKVVVVDENTLSPEHDWEKSCLVTESGRGGLTYDTMKCRECGVTGKRFGLDRTVKLDGKYRKKIYKDCGAYRKSIKEGDS